MKWVRVEEIKEFQLIGVKRRKREDQWMGACITPATPPAVAKYD